MEPLILDASVLIGLLDTADTHHSQAIQDTEAADRQGRTLLVPASAYSEALVAFARANRINDAREAVAAMGVTVAPLTVPVAECAAELRARHERLRLPDAIVLATARDLNCELLTYDRALARLARKRRSGGKTSERR